LVLIAKFPLFLKKEKLMKDIEMAVELLEKDKLALAIVKDGKVIFTSSDKGVKRKNELEGASVADRVTGKAAAVLCTYAGIKQLKTRLISDNAINVLKETNILYEYDEHAPYIKNRDKTGMCPVETLSMKVENIDELLQGIENFLDSIKKVN